MGRNFGFMVQQCFFIGKRKGLTLKRGGREKYCDSHFFQRLYCRYLFKKQKNRYSRASIESGCLDARSVIIILFTIIDTVISHTAVWYCIDTVRVVQYRYAAPSIDIEFERGIAPSCSTLCV